MKEKGFELGYPLKVALWTKDISAFEHCVCMLACVRLPNYLGEP